MWREVCFQTTLALSATGVGMETFFLKNAVVLLRLVRAKCFVRLHSFFIWEMPKQVQRQSYLLSNRDSTVNKLQELCLLTRGFFYLFKEHLC